MADTALKTADSGYLTRRLVDVAQDVIITEDDCGTGDGIYVEPIIESGEIIEPLRDRIVGRVALEDQYRLRRQTVIVKVNEEITEDLAAAIQAAGIERVKIRSVLTCESRRGVCQLCYGRNLATGRLVERGEAVGVIAAQSIGEPGTQLTMRTFHIGGTATGSAEQSTQDAKSDGFVKFIDIATVNNAEGELIAMNRNGILAIVDDKGREKERYQVVYGAKVTVSRTAPRSRPTRVLLEWDPYTFSILTEVSGTIHFKDMIEGVTMTGAGRRNHRPVAVGGDRHRRTKNASRAVIVRPGRTARRRKALPDADPRPPDGVATATKCTPATCSRRSRAPPRRPRTSPAVCRASSNCSKRASRAKPRSSRRSTAS